MAPSGKSSSHRREVGGILKSGGLLSVGIAAGGVLTLAFSLIATRFYGTKEFSSLAALLNVGAVAGVASAGVQNSVMFDIIAHGSLRVVGRHLRHLLVASLMLIALSPAVAPFLRVSGVSAAGAMLFSALTLLSCLPVAILLAQRRLLPIALLNFLQAALRILLLLLCRHLTPAGATLVASCSAVTIGALAMLVASRRGDILPADSSTTPLKGRFVQYGLGAVLFLPITVPTWLARHYLSPESAGVVALAVLLGSTIVMFAGPVTSVVTPRVRGGERGRFVSFGAWVTVAFASFATLGLAVLAPVLLPRWEGAALPGLTTDFIPVALGACLWSLALYATWVDIAAGGRSPIYLSGAVVTLLAQVAWAILAPSRASLTWGPALSGVLFGLAALIEHRRHSSLGPSAG
ncbi:MAG: hypothetical protein KGR42_00405 [Acidobacteria bacterium]|nr:hypothetical protein [Acidobacteriota bacterium]